ncbi:MAG: 3'(2'),5'-bisphosphate nucleotidase CysQ [Nitrospirae bacterium]|nr:3'(2'),5'-bisphosphate nucleotidase CysQ [Nitrospirota bacterium]
MYSRRTIIVIDKSAANLFITAILAAKEAGDAIMKIYGSDYEIEYKDDNSPLTVADRQSHEVIKGCLENSGIEKFPVLSEEGKDVSYEERKEWEYFWLVDPLDGTKEFIKRNGEFTVNIALIHKNSPIMGVVYVPVRETLYFAAKGTGAYKLTGGSLMSASKSLTDNPGESLNMILKDSLKLPIEDSGSRIPGSISVVGSRSHATTELEAFVEDLKKKYKEVDFISAGSSLKFCLVGERKADIYPRFGPTMEWDTAAGQCIVEQTGGRVISVKDKKPLSYNKRDLRNEYFICEGRHIDLSAN